jgi:hypothetical protein
MSSSLLTKKEVARWFHRPGRDGWTPAQTLRDVADVCLGALAAQGLALSLADVPFRTLLCQALCVLYQGSPQGFALAFRRPPPTSFPPGWTEEHEFLWGVYLGTELPDWLALLADVKPCEWETDLPGWRTTLVSLFPHYLVREERLLIEAGLLFDEEEDEEGM